MRRLVKTAVAAGALTLMLALSSGAEARTLWLCTPPGEDERTFVSAADAARNGIERANEKAGAVFGTQFGESCRVDSGPG
jgi:hypothetical protein